MGEWEIGAVENIHGALPYIRFAPILALVGVGVNRIGKKYCKAAQSKSLFRVAQFCSARALLDHVLLCDWWKG